MNDGFQTIGAPYDAIAATHASGGAYTLSTIVGLLNITAGLMLVAAFLLFFGGGVAYLSRLALVSRVEGLTLMAHGVRVLFVLVLTLGAVQYVQQHPQAVLWAVTIAVVIAGFYAAMAFAVKPAEEEHA